MEDQNCSIYQFGVDPWRTNVSIFLRYDTSAKVRAELFPFTFYLERYFVPFWICLGIFGNLLSLVVWTSPKLRRSNSSAIYLATLSVSDFLFMLTYSVQYLDRNWNIKLILSTPFCVIFHSAHMMSQYAAVPLVLLFTLERWISICYPFLREKFCTPKRAIMAVSIVVFLLFIIGLVQGFSNQYNSEINSCISQDWTFHKAASIYFDIIEVLMSAVLPIITLIFNILVLRVLRRITNSARKEAVPLVKAATEDAPTSEEKSRESSSFRSTTMMLLVVSFYLIVSTLPSGGLYRLQFTSFFRNGDECFTNEHIQRDRQWRIFIIYQHFKEFFDHLAITHYALNFIIYLSTSKAFRDQAQEFLTCGKFNKQMDMFEQARRRKPRELYTHKPATNGI